MEEGIAMGEEGMAILEEELAMGGRRDGSSRRETVSAGGCAPIFINNIFSFKK
ncbi:MAG: hypothetical protein K2N05_06340 [Muribaculaceae bacterium]|nr:hypothetical protein [Muribaculaceae bacterium]